MTLNAGQLEELNSKALTWILTHAESRQSEHAKAASAQEGRSIVALTTSVALAALAGLVAATALSIHHDNSVELAASLLALAGFTTSSMLFLASMRSNRFTSSGVTPSQAAGSYEADPCVEALRKARVVELEDCIARNETMMEANRQLSNWGMWTFMATPVFAVLCGWLAAV